MITNDPFVILSAERETWTPEINAQRVEFLRRQLEARQLEIVPAQGFYGNHREASFLVWLDDDYSEAKFDQLVTLARRYGQESILYVDANRAAFLVFVGDDLNKTLRYVPCGKWHSVLPTEATEHAAYSIINNVAYVAA